MGIESIDTIFVFQCGNPNQEFACPNCKKPIGGMSHKFAPGQKINIGPVSYTHLTLPTIYSV